MSVQPYDATRCKLETLIGDWTLWRFACVQVDVREEREGRQGRKRGSFMAKYKSERQGWRLIPHEEVVNRRARTDREVIAGKAGRSGYGINTR
jgi:hypothetical protein